MTIKVDNIIKFEHPYKGKNVEEAIFDIAAKITGLLDNDENWDYLCNKIASLLKDRFERVSCFFDNYWTIFLVQTLDGQYYPIEVKRGHAGKCEINIDANLDITRY